MKITRFISILGSAPWRTALGMLLLAALVIGPRSAEADAATGSRVRLQSYAILTAGESGLESPGSEPAAAAAVSVGQAAPPREAASSDGGLHLELGFWPAAVARLPEPSGSVSVLAVLAALALVRWRWTLRACGPWDSKGARGLAPALCLVVLAAVFVSAPLRAVADVPLDLNLQGRLTDEDGAPLSDSETPDIGVGVYASISGGSALYEESHADVPLHDGVFSVVIGEGTPLTAPLDVGVFAGADRYLEIMVDGDVLEPRLLFNSVPYAFQAGNAQALDGYESSDFSPSGHEHTDVPLSLSGSDAQGVVAATNSYPSGGYGVYGFASAATGSNSGVHGRTASSSGKGVYGYATAASGTTYGLRGDSTSTSGRGVYGLAAASSGETYGVYGLSKSTDGRGVYGRASATIGEIHGVYGESESASGYGVYGEAPRYGIKGVASNASGATRGVIGVTTSESGWGIHGEGPNRGVYGRATAASGVTRGVVGDTLSPEGRGTQGYASATSGQNYGVWGGSNSSEGSGVYGLNLQSDDAGSLGGPDYGVRSDGDLVVVDGAFRGNLGSNNGAPFPRPAYDSGWQAIAPDENITLNHRLGGDADNYVIDLQFKDSRSKRHHYGYGGLSRGTTVGSYRELGAYWDLLTNQEVLVHRFEDDLSAEEVRVRIWVYR